MMASMRRNGWQTTIADLALILFMVTAAAMAERPDRAAAEASLPLEAEPLAVYSTGPGAPPLAVWLAAQPRDPRQHLTIIARHRPSDAANAAGTALSLAEQARSAGYEARILIEPAPATGTTAMLSYDGRGDWHADCKENDTSEPTTDPRKGPSCE